MSKSNNRTPAVFGKTATSSVYKEHEHHGINVPTFSTHRERLLGTHLVSPRRTAEPESQEKNHQAGDISTARERVSAAHSSIPSTTGILQSLIHHQGHLPMYPSSSSSTPESMTDIAHCLKVAQLAMLMNAGACRSNSILNSAHHGLLPAMHPLSSNLSPTGSLLFSTAAAAARSPSSPVRPAANENEQLREVLNLLRSIEKRQQQPTLSSTVTSARCSNYPGAAHVRTHTDCSAGAASQQEQRLANLRALLSPAQARSPMLVESSSAPRTSSLFERISSHRGAEYCTDETSRLLERQGAMDAVLSSAGMLQQQQFELQHRQHQNSTEMSRMMKVSEERQTFPLVLHRALAELEITGQIAIASFLPDGKSFHIRSQREFEKTILPIFFPKMKSFASFQRQLNLYDFKRIGGSGIDRGAYEHELFVRDAPASASKMKRTKLKGRPNKVSSIATAATPTTTGIPMSTEKDEGKDDEE